jgi:hypothetical protein
MYRAFLQVVRDGQPDRNVISALQDLWSVPPQDLAEFLEDHVPNLPRCSGSMGLAEGSVQSNPARYWKTRGLGHTAPSRSHGLADPPSPPRVILGNPRAGRDELTDSSLMR